MNSGRWWRTRKPDLLQSMGSQRVGHDSVTEVNHRNRFINLGTKLKDGWGKTKFELKGKGI